jgi:hypothetical protein
MGHTVADRSWNEADYSVYFLYLAWRLWKSVVTLAVTRNTISGRIFGVRGDSVSEASNAVDRKSMGHTVADRSSNEADISVYFLYLAWRLWKSVVTLAVTGILFPVGFLGVRGCQCFRGIDCR